MPICFVSIVILIIHNMSMSPENSPKSHNFSGFFVEKHFDTYQLSGLSSLFSQNNRTFLKTRCSIVVPSKN